MVSENRTLSGPPSYVIGSGWWSSEASSEEVNPARKKVGDPYIRSVAFYDHWIESIDRCCDPQRIIVVDSNAPQKPAPEKRQRVEWVSLPFNAKHSTDHLGQWSGWMRSVIVSASYAIATECDYYVYVEQDCLLKGAGIVEHCIARMPSGIAFGSGEGTPQPLQQSFFIIRKDRLPGFVANLCALRMRDLDLSPEWKFLCASWTPFVAAANRGLFSKRSVRKRAIRYAAGRHFDFLDIGSGRARPIPQSSPHYYFQHGSREEVDQYLAREASE